MALKLNYQPITRFSTDDLPGVVCEPPLSFDFRNVPRRETIDALQDWRNDRTAERTLALAAELIKAVITPDGASYELGTPEAIGELIDQTELSFVESLIEGWALRAALNRIERSKGATNGT